MFEPGKLAIYCSFQTYQRIGILKHLAQVVFEFERCEYLIVNTVMEPLKATRDQIVCQLDSIRRIVCHASQNLFRNRLEVAGQRYHEMTAGLGIKCRQEVGLVEQVSRNMHLLLVRK